LEFYFRALGIFTFTANRKIEQSAGVEKKAQKEAESFVAADVSKLILNKRAVFQNNFQDLPRFQFWFSSQQYK